MDKKETYGQVLARLGDKAFELEDDIVEYRREIERDVIKDIWQTIYKAIKDPLYILRDFYIVVLNKIERIGGVPRTFVLARKSCPTPVYKQSVFKYRHLSGELEFLWVIPQQDLYYHLLQNLSASLADPKTADLAKFCHLMESGKLLEWVKKENGERPDAIIKIQKEDVCS